MSLIAHGNGSLKESSLAAALSTLEPSYAARAWPHLHVGDGSR